MIKRIGKKIIILFPDWFTQRCLQLYLSHSTQLALYLRLQQKVSSDNNSKKTRQTNRTDS